MDLKYITQWMLYSIYAGGFLILSYTAHTLTSIYYNIKVDKQTFDIKRLLSGLLKLLVLILTGIVLCFIVIVLPQFIQLIGIDIPEQIAAGVNATTMILIYLSATYKYFIEAKDKYVQIIESKTSSSDQEAVG